MNNEISSCCSAKIDSDLSMCSDCKEYCTLIEVKECFGCSDECFSDTWTKNSDNLFCEFCAEKYNLIKKN